MSSFKPRTRKPRNRNPHVRSAAVLAITVLGPTFAAAEEPIREVVVTALRSPFSIDHVPASLRVIDRETIERSGARDLSDLLRHHGAVQIRDSQGNNRNSHVSLRGFGATANVLILVDGRRLNNPDMFDPDLTQVALANVERIEILEGDAGVVHGDQAVGGVINIITRRANEARGQASVGIGSFDNERYRLMHENRFDQGFFYRVAVDVERGDGYRRNDSIDYKQFSGRLGHGYGRGELYWEGVKTHRDDLLSGALSLAELRDDRRQSGNSFNRYDIDTTVHRLVWDHALTEQLRLLVDYSDRDEDVVVDGGSQWGTTLTRQNRRNRFFAPRLVWQQDGYRVTAGADVERVDYDFELESMFGLTANSQYHRKNSYWTQLNMAATERLDAQLGVRRARTEVDVKSDGFDYDKSATVYQAGVNWRGDGWRLFLNHSESYRFSLADENVNMLTGTLNLLDVQRGRNWELGGEVLFDAVVLRAALFEQRTRNEIGYDEALGNNVNLDDTRRQGVTVEADWNLSDRVTINGLYRWMDARFREGAYQDNRLPSVARNLVKLQASVRATDWLDGYVEWSWQSDQKLDFANDAEQGGYSLTNVALRAQWESWSLQARVNNLTDKRYIEYRVYDAWSGVGYYPSPRRNYSLTLTYDF